MVYFPFSDFLILSFAIFNCVFEISDLRASSSPAPLDVRLLGGLKPGGLDVKLFDPLLSGFTMKTHGRVLGYVSWTEMSCYIGGCIGC